MIIFLFFCLTCNKLSAPIIFASLEIPILREHCIDAHTKACGAWAVTPTSAVGLHGRRGLHGTARDMGGGRGGGGGGQGPWAAAWAEGLLAPAHYCATSLFSSPNDSCPKCSTALQCFKRFSLALIYHAVLSTSAEQLPGAPPWEGREGPTSLVTSSRVTQ